MHAASPQRARALTMSMLISLGSVACSSTWMPSSSRLNRSLELAYSILLLTLDVSGDLRACVQIDEPWIPFDPLRVRRRRHCWLLVGNVVINRYAWYYDDYQEMKKILLFWQFSSVVKSKSKTA